MGQMRLQREVLRTRRNQFQFSCLPLAVSDRACMHFLTDHILACLGWLGPAWQIVIHQYQLHTLLSLIRQFQQSVQFSEQVRN